MGRTLAVFTCDVECSIGNCGTREAPLFRPWPTETWIWGRLPGIEQEWGLGRLMDQLDRRGIKGTFYVSAFENHYHDDRVVGRVAAGVEERGHEAGVHTHCAWKGFRDDRSFDLSRGYHLRDSIADHSAAVQRELLEEAVASLRRWTGRAPKSFRAGNFGADGTTLSLLADLGITSDSSRNAAVGSLRDFPSENAARETLGLLEVPATSFQALTSPRRLIRFVDPSNMTLAEARSVFDQVARLDIGTLVLVTHSFQYLSPGHVAGEQVAPHPRIVARVGRILDLLVHDDRFAFTTMRELAEMDRDVICRADGMPRNPAWMTAARLAMSGADVVPSLP
jgi:peptidoglycan/xylan/chitin deacetylase (PgdA/CDA1 family)